MFFIFLPKIFFTKTFFRQTYMHEHLLESLFKKISKNEKFIKTLDEKSIKNLYLIFENKRKKNRNFVSEDSEDILKPNTIIKSKKVIELENEILFKFEILSQLLKNSMMTNPDVMTGAVDPAVMTTSVGVTKTET